MLGLLSCCPKLTGLEIPANSRITRKSLDRMVDAERPVGSALTSLSLVSVVPRLCTFFVEPASGDDISHNNVPVGIYCCTCGTQLAFLGFAFVCSALRFFCARSFVLRFVADAVYKYNKKTNFFVLLV